MREAAKRDIAAFRAAKEFPAHTISLALTLHVKDGSHAIAIEGLANGIWLCRLCARLIDTDELRFPVELLRGWKQQALDSALKALTTAVPGAYERPIGIVHLDEADREFLRALALPAEDEDIEGVVTRMREAAKRDIAAFRAAAGEFAIPAEPDLNTILRIPGALDTAAGPADGALESAVMARVGEALDRLNQMREQEGRSIEQELRERMGHLREAVKTVQLHRRTVLQSYVERLQSRLQELLGSSVDKERVLQEAALLVDRSDIQEEIVRLENHVEHFLGFLDEPGEVGKKLDFLLQEMNREANTLLSKISGLAGEALRITEAGLAMKAEIEKSREQVQNLE